jgi:hypothetical protein
MRISKSETNKLRMQGSGVRIELESLRDAVQTDPSTSACCARLRTPAFGMTSCLIAE